MSLNYPQLLEPSPFLSSQVLLATPQPMVSLAADVGAINISSALAIGVQAKDVQLETGKIKELDDGLLVKKRLDGSIEVYVSEDV